MLELIAAERAELEQDLAQLVLALALLAGDRLGERLGRDPSAAHQDIADPVAAVDDRRVDDEPLVEVDRAEVVPVGQRQAPRPPAEEEELDDVGETGLLMLLKFTRVS